MKYKIHLGIDPGGGIAMLRELEDGGILDRRKFWKIESWVMPKSTSGVLDLITFLAPEDTSIVHATVEDVRLFTRHSKRKCSCGAVIEEAKTHQGMTNFLKSAGATLGILSALRIAHEEIAPRTWQSAFGLIAKRGERLTTTEKKNRNKEKAVKLWPSVNGITHAVADAMLLAEFGRMAHR